MSSDKHQIDIMCSNQTFKILAKKYFIWLVVIFAFMDIVNAYNGAFWTSLDAAGLITLDEVELFVRLFGSEIATVGVVLLQFFGVFLLAMALATVDCNLKGLYQYWMQYFK